MTGPRVLICEDSRTYAAALRRVIEHGGEMTVAAVCASAEEAIAALPRLRPDIVTMDIELPGMDGLAAVEQIMSSRPLPILVISAQVGPPSDKAAAALAAGALEAMAKDDLNLSDPAGVQGAALRRRITVLARAKVIRHPRGRLRGGADSRSATRQVSVVGVCASTGGPQVLARVLETLPSDFAIPVLIVQHMSAGFTEGLARWLDQGARVTVGIARDGSWVAPGAWIAPEGAHLRLLPTGQLWLDRRSAAGRHRPSGDVLLESVAAAAGRACAAIVLSGMGTDGAAGAAAVHRAGGYVIAQDEASCAVYGMPKAVAETHADAMFSPGDIAAWLLGLTYHPLRGAATQ